MLVTAGGKGCKCYLRKTLGEVDAFGVNATDATGQGIVLLLGLLVNVV